MREVFWELSNLLGVRSATRALMIERITPLFDKISHSFPFVEGCEYIDSNLHPGSTKKIQGIEVRHEDLMNLSYQDGSVDVLFHGDILEHVPDYRAALNECWRVLVPGGTLLFTCPFFDLEEHIIRCVLENGNVRHILEPAYHGNPMSEKGSLVYTQHGWPLIQEIKDAGFGTVDVGILYDPYQGVLSTNNPYPDGKMWPILFRAVK